VLAAAVTAPLLLATSSAAAPTPQPRATDHSCPEQIQEDGFHDVPQGAPHEAAIDCAVHWRLASGTSPTSYAPGAAVSRAQMATFLARLVERSGGFLPAPSRDWYGDDDASTHQDSINRLTEAGMVSGRRPGTYAPDEAVTREQMAAFLTRAYDHRARQAGGPALAEGEDYFTDDHDAGLQREINRAAAAGFTGGYGDGTYRPRVVVPRGQMASFLVRVVDLVVENGMTSVPPGPRALTSTGWQPYASVGPVALHAPGELVEVIGYHESGHDGARRQEMAPGGPRSLVLPSRSRGTDAQSAADIVVDPSRPLRSPVTGTVVRAGDYRLYCRYPDQYVVIEPDARRGWEVKLLHFGGLQVAAGQRVEAGVTVVGGYARQLPFRSQVDDHTASPHWPHVHVEVVDTAIPDRPSGGC
jgi:hypothetical protein